MNGGDVEISGACDGYDHFAGYGYGVGNCNVTVNSGKVKISGSCNDYGECCEGRGMDGGSITVTGGEVEISGSSGNRGLGIICYEEPGITVTGDGVLTVSGTTMATFEVPKEIVDATVHYSEADDGTAYDKKLDGTTDLTQKHLKLTAGHAHSFTYSASGATLTATCTEDCKDYHSTPITLTLAAEDAFYDGEPYDGNPLTCTTFTVKADTTTAGYGFVGEEGVASVTMTEESTITNVGSADNVIDTKTAKQGTELTNYTVTTEKGTLTVKALAETAPDTGTGYTLDYTAETLIADSGYEVSSTNGDTATALTNNKVTPGSTAQTFYVRRKASDANHAPSAWTAITVPAYPAAPTTGSVASATASSITVTEMANAEYSTDGTNWQDSNAFTELESTKEYTFYVRIKGTDTAMPSNTASVKAYTNQSAPKKNEGYSTEYVEGQPAITIEDDYEISTKNGTESGDTFDDGKLTPNQDKKVSLEPGKTYYVRKKASGGAGASAGTAFTAIEQPKVTVSASSSDTKGGSVDVSGADNGVCLVGTQITMTATPKDGYRFVGWFSGNDKVSEDNPYTFPADEAAILTAKFVVEQDKVESAPVSDAAASDSGSVKSLDDLKGDHYTVTSEPALTGNAGTYKLTAKLEEGYVWEDGTTADKTFFYTVNKAKNSSPAPQDLETNGTTITGFNSSTMEWRRSDESEYTSAAPTNLEYGTYYVRMKGDANTEAGEDAVIVILPPVTTEAPTEIKSDSVTLNGAATDGSTPVTYQYREVGSNDWIESATDKLTGLTADTEYEFCAVIGEGDNQIEGEIKTFRTEKKNQPTGSIQVHVKGAKNPGVAVTVEQGNTIVSTQTGAVTGGTTNAFFANLPDGYYNLVVSTGNFTETRLLEIKNGAATQAKFDIPNGALSSVVEVKKGTPKVAVDGLADLISEEEADAAAAGSKSVEVRLEVENKNTNAEGSE